MEDKFKSFVSSNRDDFEMYDLDVDLSWDQINIGLETRNIERKSKRKLWLSIAASVTLLISFSALLVWNSSKTAQPEEAIFAAVPELAEAQMYYTSQINYKLEIAQSKIDNKEVFTSLDELDAAFKDLKADLKDNADNEEVIIAMIENYQLKLKILDRILEEVKDKSGDNSSRL